jgi:hypothetical protein
MRILTHITSKLCCPKFFTQQVHRRAKLILHEINALSSASQSNRHQRKKSLDMVKHGSSSKRLILPAVRIPWPDVTLHRFRMLPSRLLTDGPGFRVASENVVKVQAMINHYRRRADNQRSLGLWSFISLSSSISISLQNPIIRRSCFKSFAQLAKGYGFIAQSLDGSPPTALRGEQ